MSIKLSQDYFANTHCHLLITSAHVSMVLDIINLLQNKSSRPFKLLMLIPDLLIIHLAHIINMSFNTGVYPDLLKIVKVIPIHKGGSTQEVNNFRPISLLSIFDKIMEKMMHKSFITALKKTTFFSKNNLVLGKIIQLYMHLLKLQKR